MKGLSGVLFLTLMMSATVPPPASTVWRMFKNMSAHCSRKRTGIVEVEGSPPRISPETMMFPILLAFGIGLRWPIPPT